MTPVIWAYLIPTVVFMLITVPRALRTPTVTSRGSFSRPTLVVASVVLVLIWPLTLVLLAAWLIVQASLKR